MEVTIKSLIQDMESAKLIIPSFQRDYVWKMEQIEALFDSLMRDIPVNSVLLWKLTGEYINSKIKFDFYKFYADYSPNRTDNERTTISDRDYKAVIDGQQRLTSLFIGFMGSYTVLKKYARKTPNADNLIHKKLYLRLTTNETNTDFQEENSPEENVYEFKFFSDDELKARCHEDTDIKPPILTDKDGMHWVRVSEIPKAKNYQEIINYQFEFHLNGEESCTLNNLWNIYHQTGRINAIEWGKENINEAITVFVRYNSKGTVLTPAQVIQSIIAVYWPNVRNAFKSLISHIRKLGFTIDVNFIVKALLTVYTSNPRNNLKAITPEVASEFQNKWDEFQNGVCDMFGNLSRLGFNDKNLTSKNATLPILVYMLKPHTVKDSHNDWQKIGRWLVRTLLAESFSGNSDKAISDAIKPLVEATEPWTAFPSAEISTSLQNYFDDNEIDELLKTQKDDKKTHLLMSFLLPKRWNLAAELDHMHPISKFKNEYPDEFERANSIVNIQPLKGKENLNKTNIAFREWISETYADDPKGRSKYFEEVGLNAEPNLAFEEREKMWKEREDKFRETLKNLLLE